MIEMMIVITDRYDYDRYNYDRYNYDEENRDGGDGRDYDNWYDYYGYHPLFPSLPPPMPPMLSPAPSKIIHSGFFVAAAVFPLAHDGSTTNIHCELR